MIALSSNRYTVPVRGRSVRAPACARLCGMRSDQGSTGPWRRDTLDGSMRKPLRYGPRAGTAQPSWKSPLSALFSVAASVLGKPRSPSTWTRERASHSSVRFSSAHAHLYRLQMVDKYMKPLPLRTGESTRPVLRRVQLSSGHSASIGVMLSSRASGHPEP